MTDTLSSSLLDDEKPRGGRYDRTLDVICFRVGVQARANQEGQKGETGKGDKVYEKKKVSAVATKSVYTYAVE